MSPEPWRDVILQSNDFVTIFITMNPFHKSDNHQLQLFAARLFLIKFKLKTRATVSWAGARTRLHAIEHMI